MQTKLNFVNFSLKRCFISFSVAVKLFWVLGKFTTWEWRVYTVTKINMPRFEWRDFNAHFYCSISTWRILVLGELIFRYSSVRSRCHWSTVCTIRIYFEMYPVSRHHIGKYFFSYKITAHAVFSKSLLKHSKSFRFLSSNQKLAWALTSTPSIALSLCFALTLKLPSSLPFLRLEYSESNRANMAE